MNALEALKDAVAFAFGLKVLLFHSRRWQARAFALVLSHPIFKRAHYFESILLSVELSCCIGSLFVRAIYHNS